MKRELICIGCPMGCHLTAEIENGDLVLVHEPICGSLREINLARREKELGH